MTCYHYLYQKLLTNRLAKVVDRDSSSIGLANEEIIYVNADHLSMCRFSEDSEQFAIIVRELQKLVVRKQGVLV